MSDLDTASSLAQQVRNSDKEKNEANKKLNEAVALLSITDGKLQRALEIAELEQTRCALLEEDLAHAKQELDTMRQVSADCCHERSSAQIQTDLTVAFIDADHLKLSQLQIDLANALQDSAASRAAFLALSRSSSASVLDANHKLKEEWAHRMEILEQVTLLPDSELTILNIFTAHSCSNRHGNNCNLCKRRKTPRIGRCFG